MDRIWIVVANASRARVYERDPDTAALTERSDFVHLQSRAKGSELQHDRAGHSVHGFGTAGRGHTAYEPPTDLHTRERQKFARELAQWIEAAAHDRRCPGWMLFASSGLLGEIKALLGPAASRGLIKAEAADLTAWSERELARRVIDVLETTF